MICINVGANCARPKKSDFVQKAGHFHDLAGHLVKKRDCPAKSGTVGRSASVCSGQGFRPHNICLARMKKTIFAKQQPQQSGFTRSRSTLDRIIALRLLAERQHEYCQPLYAAYIEFRAAFKLTLWTATPFGAFLKLLIYHQHLLTSSKLLIHPPKVWPE